MRDAARRIRDDSVEDGPSGPWPRPAVWAVRDTSGEAYGGGDDRTEADDLEELGDEIVRLVAHGHAAKRHVLTLVAEFDRREGWKAGGHRSCAHWLAFRTGYALGTAREHARVARALEELPAIGHAMARGRLSFCQVRALTRVATPETEVDLLGLAEGATTAQLERMVRAWKKGTRQDEEARDRERHRSRRLSIFRDDDGMIVVRAWLEPEAGMLFIRALEAAEDALYHQEERDDADPPLTDREARVRASRRRADAASSPSGRWRRASAALPPPTTPGKTRARTSRSAAPGPSATRSSSTSTGPPWRPTARPDAPSWRTGRTFHMKRPGGSPVTPRWWASSGAPTERCWTWAAAPARSRPRSDGRSKSGIGAAAFRAAGSASPTPTTSRIGRTVGRPASRTRSCSAAATEALAAAYEARFGPSAPEGGSPPSGEASAES